MKFFKFLIVCALFLVLASISYAIDEEALKEKIAKNLEKIIANTKIQDPTKYIPTRSPEGPKLYRQLVNSVVFIGTSSGGGGSGVVISSNGLIVTNWHVVENESKIGIAFKPRSITESKIPFSKRDVFWAKVLKTDPTRDLALLKVVSIPPNLTAVLLGSLSEIEIGSDVCTISHPEGLLWSYNEGVISQIRPKYEWTSESGSVHRATLIQTQTVISYGSSGAPLFNFNGRLIGILFGGIEGTQGLNFAIAIDEVRQFILEFLEKR